MISPQFMHTLCALFLLYTILHILTNDSRVTLNTGIMELINSITNNLLEIKPYF